MMNSALSVWSKARCRANDTIRHGVYQTAIDEVAVEKMEAESEDAL